MITNKTFSYLPIDNQPVYLTASGELAKMNTDHKMIWSAGQKTKILCSGPNNRVVLSPTRDIAEIECVSGMQFKLGGQTKNFTDIKCKEKIKGDVQVTSQTCGNGAGTLLKIGFKGHGNTFVTFIESCYKKSTGSVLYTRHPLHGDAVFSDSLTPTRQNFRLDGTVPQCASMDEYFVLVKQKDRFTKESATLGERFTIQNRLDRGHLTPYADAIFPTWKMATQFYVNTAPEWNKLNGVNWRKVEAMSRGIAKDLRKTLDVYTGTFGILNLDNVDMKLMGNGFVEVPKWFWKIIRDPATDQGIALVSLNNIFATEKEYICPDICKATNWYIEKFDDYRRGFTYCCDVNSLRNVVRHIPTTVSASSRLMFKGPSTTSTTAIPRKRGRGQ